MRQKNRIESRQERTNRLDELIKADPGIKERVWFISGIVVVAVITLQIEGRLKMIE